MLETPPVTIVADGEDATLQCKVKDEHGSLVPPCRVHGSSFKWLVNDEQIASCNISRLRDGYEFDTQTGTLRIQRVNMSMNGLNFSCQFFGVETAKNATRLSVFSKRELCCCCLFVLPYFK